jgi:hypothetical protein
MYRRYDGDLDGLSRSGDRHAGSSDGVWRVIDDLRQRAFVVANGRSSEAFLRDFESDLIAYVPDERARSDSWQMIDVDLRRSRPEVKGPSAGLD